MDLDKNNDSGGAGGKVTFTPAIDALKRERCYGFAAHL